jgi:hypothetical protein
MCELMTYDQIWANILSLGIGAEFGGFSFVPK